MRLLQQHLCVGWAVIGSSGWTSHAFLLSSGAGRFSRPMAMLGPTMSDVRIHKDVVVIGGGLAGLSTALELAKRGKQVTVLSRNRAEAAAEAAGGMIAPQAERLESGPYLDLCLTSRAMYAEWVRSIEAIAGMGGDKARGNAAAAETHFWSSGGFMSPAFEGDAVHMWSPPPEGGQAHWIDRDQALEMEPSLSPDIVGAWWFPQDMSIDAQRMFRVLEQACSKGGVEILQGTAAASLVYDSEGTSVDGVVLEDGRQLHANAVVSAAGAWMRELMPVPMVPHKGQMMALREPAGGLGAGAPRQGGGIGLTRVFFAEGCYIIPKRDGRIVVGSTVEVGEYGLHNTPAGMKQIIDAAVKVCPALADLAIERTWAGLRPVTPDCFPVLGASPRCPNLFVAGGYWRNGVLLAPKTAQLVADAVCGLLSPQDEGFLQEFSMDRFTKPGKSAAAARGSEPRVQPAAAVKPQRPAPTGALPSSGLRAEDFISEATPSEVLEMERAALEGANDASMLSALEDMFGKGMVQVEKAEEENVPRDVPSTHASSTDSVPASAASTSKVEEPVNDYHASEQFSEEKLKEARMANRLLQEDSSDARLEAVFGGGPEESGLTLPEGIANINSWDDGAAEVANMIGAELVEMEVDIPDGMTIEEALAQQGPMAKVWLESPSGEEVEVPRGMNVAGMVEAGLIAPVGGENDDEEGFFVEEGAGARAWKVQETPAGTFDPSAVKGAEERSTEVSELYAKVMANKAKAKGIGGEEASKTSSPATTRIGHNGSNVGNVKDVAKGANSWLGDILAMGQGSGGSKDNREVEDAHSGSGDKVEGTAHVGAGTEVTSESEGAAAEAEEMVGYDFILKDRGDEEGKLARSARASTRDAPEGQDAWENYEKIANEAMASVGGMEPVEYLPP